MTKLNIRWVEWPVDVNWSGRWVAEKERTMTKDEALAAVRSNLPVPAAPKPKEAAFEMERLAFELNYIREELIRTGVFQQLPLCRQSLADAAAQLRIVAQLHREVKNVPA